MKLTLIGCFLFFLIPLALFSQQKKGFEINGRIKGLKVGEKILLAHFTDPGLAAVRDDSCYANINGDFHLSGFTAVGPFFYVIAFDNDGVKHRIRNERLDRNIGGGGINLFVNNGDTISINAGDINTMQQNYFENEVSISGGSYNAAALALKPTFYTIARCFSIIDHRIEKIRDSVGFDKSLIQGMIEAREAIDQGLRLMLSTEYPFPTYRFAAIALLDYLGNYHSSILTSLYENLNENEKSSYYGKLLKSKAALAIGQPLPGFDLPNVDGKVVSLKDIVSKSKITLVHLWASNSVDREKYQRELIIFYKKYHEKGLNVIGVSADSLVNEWRTRLLVEQYPWANVSDLKGNLTGGIVQDLYHEGGHNIPNTTNILLDKEGRIIAWDANGVELQWYLWKYLGD